MVLPIIVSQDDIQALIDNEVSESRVLEFKRDLPGNSREDRVEFLADVSSFANASGGIILYGIAEENGTASEIAGLQNDDLDDAKLRLEQIIRDGLDPRVIGIDISDIALGDETSLIKIGIPRSFNSPHAVTLQGHWRFYSRNSAGKYPLDVTEVRNVFVASEALPERLRNFRAERLNRIVAGETPLSLARNAKLVFHLVPLGFFGTGEIYDIDSLQRDRGFIYTNVVQIYGAITGHRYNIDGIVTFRIIGEDAATSSYTQVFRNGVIESVDTDLLRSREVQGVERLFIPSVAYEQNIREQYPKYIGVLQRMNVQPPIALFVSLLGVKGYFMGVSQALQLQHFEQHPIDRDNLVLPEVIIEDYEANVDEVLRPIFDFIWNAAGWPRSFNYDDNGEWRPQR